MPPIDAEELSLLSELLEAARDLAPDHREPWLQALPPAQRHLLPMVRAMLRTDPRDAVPALIDRGPRLAPGPAADAGLPCAGEPIGPYRLVREIGRGGMGTVWLAQQELGLRRQVALKLPRLVWGEALAARMARERDIGALLVHPHIARLYDAGFSAQGRPYLAMEYIDGEPIDTWCGRARHDVGRTLRLFVQVARAVAHAHGRLVVHRDLKPSNVLVSADGSAHLLDFGIAKLLDDGEGDGMTQEFGRLLTPRYASPEQLRGEVVAVASDIYSLGVVLHELLTGEVPHAGAAAHPVAMLAAIEAGERPPASVVAADAETARRLRGELDAIVAKALDPEPAQRYATAESLADDIERHLRGELVLAQPPSLGYRSRKLLQRHGGAIAAAAAVGFAIVAGSAAALLQARRANDEAAHAQQAARRANVVKDFVVDVFKVNAPDSAAKVELRQLPAELLLDRGAGLIESRFAGQHDLQAELYGVVARILLDMKAGERALAYGRKHVEALEAARARPAERAAGLLLYGEVLAANLRTVDAERLARQALALAPAGEPRVRAAVQLAEALWSSNRGDESLVQLGAADAALAADPALPRALEARAVALRARVLTDRARFEAARPLYERAIALAVAADGPSSRLASKLRIRFAQQLAGNGQAEEARTLFRQTFAAMRAAGGPDDLDAALAEADAAYSLGFQGLITLDQAAEMFDRTLRTIDRQSARLPAWVRAGVVSTQGCLWTVYGQFEQGYALVSRADPVLRAVDQVGGGGGCLPFAQMVSGRHDEAEAGFRRSVDSYREGDGCRGTCGAHEAVMLSNNRMMQGRYAEARRALDEAGDVAAGTVSSRRLMMNPKSAVQAAYARIALEQGDPAGALQRLAGLENRQYMVNDVRLIRGQALCETGHVGEGSALLEEGLEDWTRSVFGRPNNPRAADFRARAGLCELRAGHRDRALQLARAAREALQAQPGISPFFKAASAELDRRLQPSERVRR